MSQWIVISLGSLKLKLSFYPFFVILGFILMMNLVHFYSNFSVLCYRLILLDLIFGGLSKASSEDENEADSVSKS